MFLYRIPEFGQRVHLVGTQAQPDLNLFTGRYFASRKPETSSKASRDTAAAARLWQISADLTGLSTRGRETQRRGT